jgi:hypothetical protein
VKGSRTEQWHDRTGLTLESAGLNATYVREPGGDRFTQLDPHPRKLTGLIHFG